LSTTERVTDVAVVTRNVPVPVAKGDGSKMTSVTGGAVSTVIVSDWTTSSLPRLSTE
jgi:hypothetical protein